MDDVTIARMQRDMDAMSARIDKVANVAEGAAFSISAHEQVCAQRYENIADKLDNIPKLFDLMGALQKHVYIGMGMVLVVGYLLRLVK